MRIKWRNVQMHLQQAVPAYVVLLAALALTGVVWHYIQRTERMRDENHIHIEAQATVQAMEQRASAYMDVLNGLGSLFALKEHVTLQDFYAFLDHDNLNERCPGFYLIGFTPQVRAADQMRHVAQMQRLGYSDYRIFPAGQRPVYYPAIFLYPYDVEGSTRSERNMVGLDASADPARWAAMQRARDTGRPTATRPITFAHDATARPGLLVYFPIYENNAYLNSVADRRAKLKGFVFVGFKLQDFFAGLPGEAQRRFLGFSVYNGAAASTSPLYRNAALLAPAIRRPPRFVQRARLDLAGQPLSVRFFSLPALHTGPQVPALTALTGIILSLFLYVTVLQRLRTIATRRLAEEARRQADEAEKTNAILRKSEERFRSIFEQATVGIAQIGLDGRFLQANQRLCAISGRSEQDLLRQNYLRLIHPDDAAELAEQVQRLLAGQTGQVAMERRFMRGDGCNGWAHLSLSLARDVVTAAPDHILAIVEDITDRKQAVEALRASEEKFRATIEHSPVGVAQASLGGDWLHVNKKFCEITGYSAEELYRLTAAAIIHPDDLAGQSHHVKQLLDGDAQSFCMECRYLRRDATVVWTSLTCSLVHRGDGLPAYLLCVVEDISERKKSQERLAHLAQYDSLTGLPNRHLFRDRLAHALEHAARRGSQVALLFMDMDKFKEINDSMGHSAGDRVLAMVAERLRNCLRASDTVARFGGDEFIVILEDVASEADAGDVANKLMEAITPPYNLDGVEFFLSTSIGIALYPRDAGDNDALLKNADLAMYQAKDHGRNNYQFFTPAVDAQSAARIRMKNLLRHALERGELELYYQPQIDMATGRLTGAEALLRWRNPELGMVSPATFVPLLEETGWIMPVGEWILRTACAQNQAWQQAGLPGIRMAVNLSARQLRNPYLAEEIIHILAATGLPPQSLEVEITEGMLIENMDFGKEILACLRQHGVHVALDDFGTGYSSLSYLKNLPLDVLKMDGSFVRNLAGETADAANATAIARAIITLAHSLHLAVVAEAVETEEQRARLLAMGCDILQGYLFSRPLPAEEMTRLMTAALPEPSEN